MIMIMIMPTARTTRPDEFRQLAPFHVAMDEHGHEEGVDDRNRARLRRGEDARDNAADDDGNP